VREAFIEQVREAFIEQVREGKEGCVWSRGSP